MPFDPSRVTLPARILATQIGVTVALAVGWSSTGIDRGASSALAGVAVIVPNAFFAWRASTGHATLPATDQARRLIGSSVAKVVLGVVLLTAIFVTYRPEPLAFFVTLILVQAVHWIAPWIDVPRRRRT
jgi:F0F1-type ATP synthase assembly protein I